MPLTRPARSTCEEAVNVRCASAPGVAGRRPSPGGYVIRNQAELVRYVIQGGPLSPDVPAR
jgi:hypothetical protein